MKNIESIIESIFNINSLEEFESIAMQVFYYQAQENKVYRDFINLLGKDPKQIKTTKEIPFLPISFFKSHSVTTKNTAEIVFKSSGTTGQLRSQHLVHSSQLYERSFVSGFNTFYSNYKNYTFLALLPSYIEQKDSSLVYMADYLIKNSTKSKSAFYLDNTEELNTTIDYLENNNKPYVLLGVSYALLDFIEQHPKAIKQGIIMETGGMKGRRKELTKTELHQQLKQGFGVEKIHSEYGMTELLSQAYSLGNELYECVPWMNVLTRSTNDPFDLLNTNSRGLISVIDLANIYSCSFIATDDLGVVYPNNSFEILGRFDQSELRGCNLMIGDE